MKQTPNQFRSRSLATLHSRARIFGGFTLIELIVSLGVFIIIVTIAVGGFVSALRTQRQVAALISANNNVSLALEQMAREIRTGRNFCDISYPISCSQSALVFSNAGGDVVVYRKDINGGSFIERGVFNGSGFDFQRITGTTAFIWTLNFFVRYQDINDTWPTRVTIAVGVSAKEPGVSGGIVHLQTTVSSRQKDEPL